MEKEHEALNAQTKRVLMQDTKIMNEDSTMSTQDELSKKDEVDLLSKLYIQTYEQNRLAVKYLDDVNQIITERDILQIMIVNHQVDEIEKLFLDMEFDKKFTDEHQALLDAVKEQDKIVLKLEAELGDTQTQFKHYWMCPKKEQV